MVFVDLSYPFENHFTIFVSPVFEHKIVATAFIFALNMNLLYSISVYSLEIQTRVFPKFFVTLIDFFLQTLDSSTGQRDQLLVEVDM